LNASTTAPAATPRNTLVRGAPLVGVLVLLSFAGLSAALSAPSRGATGTGLWSLGLLLAPVVYGLMAPGWARKLAAARWPSASTEGSIWPEVTGLSASFALALGAYAASLGHTAWLAWLAFACQLLILTVLSPVTLRRFPGVIPR